MNPSTQKMASDMVAAQIGAYDHEIQRIDEQIAQLEARKQAVNMMRAALRPLLQADGGKSSLAEQSGAVSSRPLDLTMTQAGNIVAIEAKARPLPTVSGSGTGFADAVRAVLRDYPKGVKPIEVVEEMRSRGSASTYTGKVPFSVRVGNELYRLSKGGEVIRRAGRYYLAGQEERK